MQPGVSAGPPSTGREEAGGPRESGCWTACWLVDRGWSSCPVRASLQPGGAGRGQEGPPHSRLGRQAARKPCSSQGWPQLSFLQVGRVWVGALSSSASVWPLRQGRSRVGAGPEARLGALHTHPGPSEAEGPAHSCPGRPLPRASPCQAGPPPTGAQDDYMGHSALTHWGSCDGWQDLGMPTWVLFSEHSAGQPRTCGHSSSKGPSCLVLRWAPSCLVLWWAPLLLATAQGSCLPVVLWGAILERSDLQGCLAAPLLGAHPSGAVSLTEPSTATPAGDATCLSPIPTFITVPNPSLGDTAGYAGWVLASA